MRFPRLGRFLLGVVLSFTVLWAIGCGSDGGDNPIAAGTAQGPVTTAGSANLSFQIVIPSGWTAPTPAILAQTVATPTVEFKVILFDVARLATYTLTKIAEVVNQKAIATFTALPSLPAVGKLSILGGKINGTASFSGCLDLVIGNNVMTVSPDGSNATTTVAAYVMEQLAKNAASLANAPVVNLATAINIAIAGLTDTGETLYTKAVSAFSTALTISTLSTKLAAAAAGLVAQIGNMVTDAALANVSDYSSLAALSLTSIRADIRPAIVIPPLPTTVPTIPSGNYTLATTTVLGTAPNKATINWYLYANPFDLPTSWAEWVTTITKDTTAIFKSYWQLAAPVAKSDTAQTRGFSGSGWNGSNLAVYTIGTGTFQTTGAVSASGTQVANVVLPTGLTQNAYTFDITGATDGSANGTIVLNDGGSITFAKTAPNASNIGTNGIYTQSTGTINAVTPTARTLTFKSIVYGNNTLQVEVTTSNITTTLTYNGDGSGQGFLSGNGLPANLTADLTWDMTGVATATISGKVLGQTVTKTVSTTIVPRPVDEVPGL